MSKNKLTLGSLFDGSGGFPLWRFDVRHKADMGK